jgi:lipopolysaccharide transport system ATP-binding protein
VLNPVSRQAGLWVQIDAEVERPDPALTVGYCIYSDDGALLYWTYHSDYDWTPLEAGTIRLRGELPAQVLNEGSYRVELIGGLHNSEWLFEPGVNAPHLTLVVRGNYSESPLWLEKRPGVLAPGLRWKRESLGNSPLSDQSRREAVARAAEGDF